MVQFGMRQGKHCRSEWNIMQICTGDGIEEISGLAFGALEAVRGGRIVALEAGVESGWARGADVGAVEVVGRNTLRAG